jgi:hypothetical protein
MRTCTYSAAAIAAAAAAAAAAQAVAGRPAGDASATEVLVAMPVEAEVARVPLALGVGVLARAEIVGVPPSALSTTGAAPGAGAATTAASGAVVIAGAGTSSYGLVLLHVGALMRVGSVTR